MDGLVRARHALRDDAWRQRRMDGINVNKLATIGRALFSRCGKVPPARCLAMSRSLANIHLDDGYSGGAWASGGLALVARRSIRGSIMADSSHNISVPPFGASVSRAEAAAIDAGLRAHML